MATLRSAKPRPGLAKKQTSYRFEARRAPASLKFIAKSVDLGVTGITSYALRFDAKHWPFFHGVPDWEILLSTMLLMYVILTVIPHWIFAQTIGEILFGIKLVTTEEKRLTLLQTIARDMILFPLDFCVPWRFFKDKSLQDTLTHTQQLKLYEVRAQE